MSRITLYSSSRQPASAGNADSANRSPDAGADASAQPHQPVPPARRRFLKRYERALLVSGGAAIGLLAVALYAQMAAKPQKLTQHDIDLAVLHTLETKPMPSHASQAYEIIRPSVVRVRQLKVDDAKAEDGGKDAKHKDAPSKKGDAKKDPPKQEEAKKDDPKKTDPKSGDPKSGDPKAEGDDDKEEAVGTGVVIQDDGKILTALHVVAGAKRVGVIFADGTESDADVIGTQPENDLAVLQAKTLPDDLYPATIRSTRGLREGDEVMAVGFPFGIGPSLSAGVISGFGRAYKAGKDEQAMTNLIQFDAAANPGNSGGPLITAKGEVVGIVTAILNPTDQAFFVGIGFAVPIENAAAAAGMSPF